MFRLGRLVVSLLVLLVVAFGAACSDPTGPRQVEAEAALVPNRRVAYCAPQPAAAASALIGPAGGSLRAGRHELTFPAGAVRKPTLITMVAPRDTVSQVVFGPEGLTFPIGRQPELTMSYRGCRFPTVAVKRIVYTNDSLQARENLLTVDNPTRGEVKAKLNHFSRYALMY